MDGTVGANRNCFCEGNCIATEAIRLANSGDLEQAYPAARRAVLNAPNCPFAHGVLGFVMNSNGLAIHAERQINIAKQLGDNHVIADTQLGFSFIAQGTLTAAENAFKSALAGNINHFPAHIGLAKVFDARGEYDKALAVADQVFAVEPDSQGLRFTLAKILISLKNHERAMSVLEIATDVPSLYERGKLKEKLGDYFGAFSDYTLANQSSGKIYEDDKAAQRIASHKLFTSRKALSRLPRIESPIGKPMTPIFVTGYPRSGTTLTETILSNHPHIHAGDELPFIGSLARMSQAWLGADVAYPLALNELVIGDKTAILYAMRAYYMNKALALFDRSKLFQTDKMPLNEMHLPLISMLFAEAPIIYVRRHPMDIVFSNFATYLTHGFNQSFSLYSSALHYSRVDDLVLHYKRKVDMRFAEVRYEEMVSSPDTEIRGLLDFVGVEFDPACLSPETNRNHPRTPSYEAVKKPINDTSIGRWRNFEPWIGDALRVLEPIMVREGY